MKTEIQFMPSQLDKLRVLTEELTEEDTKLQLFFTLSPDMFCIADRQGDLITVNDAWTRILGWSEEELMSHTLLDLVHPDDIARTKAIMAHMSDHDIIRFHNRYKMKDKNDYVVLEWSATKWTDGLTYAAARPVPEECMKCPDSEKRFGSYFK